MTSGRPTTSAAATGRTRPATSTRRRLTTAPGAPTGVTTTVLSAKSSRVAFNPPANNGGSAITSYRAQCTSPNGGTSRTAERHVVADHVHQPDAGQGTTGAGSRPPTRWAPAATRRTRTRSRSPPAAPDRPTNVTATAVSRTSAKVAFTAPAYDGGAAITSYRVQCASSDGGTARTVGRHVVADHGAQADAGQGLPLPGEGDQRRRRQRVLAVQHRRSGCPCSAARPQG